MINDFEHHHVSAHVTMQCPACGHHVAVAFYDGGRQPLATLSWPSTADEAQSLPKYELDFVMCVDCGHVFNRAFDYANVPYSDKPNLMFNRGEKWAEFMLHTRDSILDRLPENPVVVEIGHGDGSFLAAMAKARPGGRFVGFDPHGATQDSEAVKFRAELFDPIRHLTELAPDAIVSRHVLEHLVNPLGFLQSISFAASQIDLAPLVYLEVPCIDVAIASKRTVDFYYEHSSQFTTNSFRRMLTSAAEVLEIGHGYSNEVVYGFARMGLSKAATVFVRTAAAFREAAATDVISTQLAELAAAGKRVAIWGGTGKSAAFMCRYAVDCKRFPLVVDSDQDKVGTFVPGTGQVVRFRDWLLAHPVDVVIVPPQWRAADIMREMAQVGITVNQVLIEHCGRLIDIETDDHPYAK